MENNKMNDAWQYYESMLDKNLKLNEEVLKQMNLERVYKELRVPKTNSLVSMIVCAMCVLMFIMWAYVFLGHTLLLVCCIISALIFSLYTFFAIREFKLISAIDIYCKPVLELQKSIAEFEKCYMLAKKIEFATFPVLMAVISPVMVMHSNGINIFAHWQSHLAALIAAIVAGYLLTVWLYRHVYERRIKNARDFLCQIESFDEV